LLVGLYLFFKGYFSVRLLKTDFNKPLSEVVGTGAGFFMDGQEATFARLQKTLKYIAEVQNEGLTIANLAKLSLKDELRTTMMLIYVVFQWIEEEFKAQFDKFPEEAFPEAIDNLQRNRLIKVEDGKIRLIEEGDPWRFNIA
jgi:coproporphyrinogen III oxidase-like Fe-S oxidoreductase